MRRMLAAVAAVALVFTAGVAVADEVAGEVQNIDATMKTFTVSDKTFQWSENSTGVKLDEIEEGDKVKVMYQPNQDGHNDVMEIMKEE